MQGRRPRPLELIALVFLAAWALRSVGASWPALADPRRYQGQALPAPYPGTDEPNFLYNRLLPRLDGELPPRATIDVVAGGRINVDQAYWRVTYYLYPRHAQTIAQRETPRHDVLIAISDAGPGVPPEGYVPVDSLSMSGVDMRVYARR